jgi:quercetin dioxygenase-like cupin family protein
MSHRYSARPALLLATLALFAALPLPLAQGEPLVPARLTPGELKWVTQPNGNQQAVMAGNQKETGLYMYRTRFAANYRNKPHFHPDQRIVTVMSGTLYVGYGEKMDDSQMKALPAGSIFTEPPRQPHYVWAKDGEVVIQVTGYGPSGTTQIEQK